MGTLVATNHTKHEFCLQDKHIIEATLAQEIPPKGGGWSTLPCDIIHNPYGNCQVLHQALQQVHQVAPPSGDPTVSAGSNWSTLPCNIFRDVNGNSQVPRPETQFANIVAPPFAVSFGSGFTVACVLLLLC